MVQDGMVHQRSGAVRRDGGVGGRRGGQGHEVGLGAMEGLPLALSLGRSSLSELGQTTALLFDHLLT